MRNLIVKKKIVHLDGEYAQKIIYTVTDNDKEIFERTLYIQKEKIHTMRGDIEAFENKYIKLELQKISPTDVVFIENK